MTSNRSSAGDAGLDRGWSLLRNGIKRSSFERRRQLFGQAAAVRAPSSQTLPEVAPDAGVREVEALREALVVAGDHNSGESTAEEIAVTATQLFTALQAAKHAVFKKSDARRRSLIVNPAIRELLVEAEEVLKSLRPEAVSAVATADAPARRRADSDDEAEGVAKQVKTFGRKISALVNGFGAGANVEPGDDPFASNEVLKVMAAPRKRSAVPASINLDEEDED